MGCDSTVTLHLTINYSVRDTIYDTAANSYTWNGETYTESGQYLFVGNTAEGCDSLVMLFLTINQVGITPAEPLSTIVVYPNPTTGTVTIQADEVERVEIYDNAGRLVGKSDATRRLDLSNLPSGTYLLRITTPQGTAVSRVVKR